MLSLGLDKGWRKRLIKLVYRQKAVDILDVATGTGDVAIALSNIPNVRIDAADLSTKMLAVQEKQLEKRKLKDRVKLHVADAERLPFDTQFDAVTVAFGIRNFANLEKGLSEMYLVLYLKYTPTWIQNIEIVWLLLKLFLELLHVMCPIYMYAKRKN